MTWINLMHDLLLFYTGLSFFSIFFWFVMYFYSRNYHFLLLILVTISHVMYNLNLSGVILHSQKAEPVIIALLTFTFSWMGSAFVELKKNVSTPIYYSIVTVTLTIITVQLLAIIIFDLDTAITISYLLLLVNVIVAPLLFIYFWIAQKSRSALFCFITFFPAMVGTILECFARLGFISTNVYIVGPLAMIYFEFLAYYGMITYIISIKIDRERVRLEKEQLIQEQNIILEQKVQLRTLELRAEQERSEELLIKASQKQMIELELQSLRAQLNPHFMFNSLNAIQDLIVKEDFENSHTYLAKFARLLRMLLENTEKPFTSLQKELDFLALYLSLEKLRLPNLQFSITTDASINKEETIIPNMILQPFIENALWHGLSSKEGERKLELYIQKEDGIITYHVKDNGIGRTKSAELKTIFRKQHKSKGMELLSKRFKLLNDEFGSNINAEVSDIIENGNIGGTEVSIMVPDSLKYKK
jgi:sensor histidine kinase YesM